MQLRIQCLCVDTADPARLEGLGASRADVGQDADVSWVVLADPDGYALKVASATAAAFGSQLAGVYLHGSAVLGGFDPRRSDVDVLVVCDGPMTSAQQSAVAEALSEQRLPCPGRGWS